MESSGIIHIFLTQTPPAAEAAAPSVVLPDYGFMYSITHAGTVEQLTMGLLLVFSVISWGIIAYKAKILRRAFVESEIFLDTFWGSKRLDAIYQKSETLSASPISQVFRAGYIELAKLKKREKTNEKGEVAAIDPHIADMPSIERSMRRALAAELTGLESLVPFLATVGSTAPFIGLFGTVIGIMTSFQDIGAVGNANLATVAPGIGGALIATAFGLFAAIPAVIAYNFFLSKIRVITTEMDNFSSDFLNIVKRHFF